MPMKTDGNRPGYHTRNPKISNTSSGKSAQFKHKKLSPHESERKTPLTNESQEGVRLSERSVSQDTDEHSASLRAEVERYPDADSDIDSDYASDFESDSDSDDSLEFTEYSAPLPHIISHANDYITPDADPNDKYPLIFWGEQIIHQLQEKAITENRPVSIDDYWQLYDTGKINLLTTNGGIYHEDEIEERIQQINDQRSKTDTATPAGKKRPDTINRYRWIPEIAEQLFLQHQKEDNVPLTLEDYLECYRQEQSNPTIIGRKSGGRFQTTADIQKKLDQFNQSRKQPSAASLEKSTSGKQPVSSTRAASSFYSDENNRKLEKTMGTGAMAGALVSGAAVATASAMQPAHDLSKFDHILQKDTPLDQMIILGQHNAGALAGQGTLPMLADNQNMSIEDALNKTPIRGFDLDLHRHNGDIVINHGGIFDSTVSDDNIPRVDDILKSMNHWLDKPGNSNEVIFLNFENKWHLPSNMLENTFGHNSVLDQDAYSQIVHKLGRAPTVNEMRAEGYKVVDFNHNRYINAGTGETGFRDQPIDSVWEDRTLLSLGKDLDLEFGKFKTSEIAPKITTDDVDQYVDSGKGMYISLDHVSANDPRFFKPEDRDSLTLNPDLQLMGLFYESDEAFQNALLGLGTFTASATVGLATAGGAYQGLLNEKKIRNQDKLMPKHLQAMELSEILQRRKKSKKLAGKPLDSEVTIEEIKDLYKKNQLKIMTRDTAMAGANGTVSLTGSALALGMLFPPLLPAFGGTSAGIAVAGSGVTLLATLGNKKRMSKAIDKAFDDPGVMKALKQRVAAMNREIANCVSKSGDAESLLSSMASKREEGERLLKASNVMLSTALVARASGLSKYGLPALGTAAMGVGASITGVLVALSAAMNYRDRRSKLQNLPQTTSEVLRPDYGRKQKRKLGLFGDTAFQRFMIKQKATITQDLQLQPDCSMKEIALAFSLPGNEVHLEKHLRSFAKKEWIKDLKQFASQQKPKLDFETVRTDSEALKALLTQYAIKRVGDFAHNDTFSAGYEGTARLALIGAFSGVFFLPMLGVAAGAMGIGLAVSKGVAVHERKVFTQKLTELIEKDPGDDPEKIASHNSLHGMINSWVNMLGTTV